MQSTRTLINSIIRHELLTSNIQLKQITSIFCNDHIAHFGEFIHHISGTKGNTGIDISIGYMFDQSDNLYVFYKVNTITSNKYQSDEIFTDSDLVVSYLNQLETIDLPVMCTTTIKNLIFSHLPPETRHLATTMYNRKIQSGRRLEFIKLTNEYYDMESISQIFSKHDDIDVIERNGYLAIEYHDC